MKALLESCFSKIKWGSFSRGNFKANFSGVLPYINSVCTKFQGRQLGTAGLTFQLEVQKRGCPHGAVGRDRHRGADGVKLS